MAGSEVRERAPQFGVPVAGATYLRRPARYGVAAREDGRIATVRIDRHGRVTWDLPGGMIDPGETGRQALVREFAEETGRAVEPLHRIAAARQYTVTSAGEHRDNRCVFYACRLLGATGGKIEDDHELVWLDPLDALRRLQHDAAAWAVTCWLRAG